MKLQATTADDGLTLVITFTGPELSQNAGGHFVIADIVEAYRAIHKILAMLRERHLDAELATGRGQIRVYLQRPTSTS